MANDGLGDSFPMTRLGTWLPAAMSLGLSALILLGSVSSAADGGQIAFYLLFTAVTAWVLVRSRRVGVQISDAGVVVRGLFQTCRYDWPDVAEAGIIPMRTASPFAGRWPYVALGLRLHDGRVRRFDAISASATRSERVERVVNAINTRRSG